MDSRIPADAGTEHVGFSPPRETLLAPSAKRQARSAVRSSASRAWGGVISCMPIVVCHHKPPYPYMQCRDGARIVFTAQGDIACTDREAKREVLVEATASRINDESGILPGTKH